MDRAEAIGYIFIIGLMIGLMSAVPLFLPVDGTITSIHNTYTADGLTYTNYTVTYHDQTTSFISPCSLYHVGSTVPLIQRQPPIPTYSSISPNTDKIPKGC